MYDLLGRDVLLLERRGGPELPGGRYSGLVAREPVAPGVGHDYLQLVRSFPDISGDVGHEGRIPYRLKPVAVDFERSSGAERRDADENPAIPVQEILGEFGFEPVGHGAGVIFDQRVQGFREVLEASDRQGAEQWLVFEGHGPVYAVEDDFPCLLHLHAGVGAVRECDIV